MSARREGKTLIISVAGSLNGVNAPKFEDELNTEIRSEDQAIIVNFENLTYICSMGLQHVLVKAKELGKRGSLLVVCSLSDSVKEVFETLNFQKIIPVYASLTEALDTMNN